MRYRIPFVLASFIACQAMATTTAQWQFDKSGFANGNNVMITAKGKTAFSGSSNIQHFLTGINNGTGHLLFGGDDQTRSPGGTLVLTQDPTGSPLKATGTDVNGNQYAVSFNCTGMQQLSLKNLSGVTAYLWRAGQVSGVCPSLTGGSWVNLGSVAPNGTISGVNMCASSCAIASAVGAGSPGYPQSAMIQN